MKLVFQTPLVLKKIDKMLHTICLIRLVPVSSHLPSALLIKSSYGRCSCLYNDGTICDNVMINELNVYEKDTLGYHVHSKND